MVKLLKLDIAFVYFLNDQYIRHSGYYKTLAQGMTPGWFLADHFLKTSESSGQNLRITAEGLDDLVQMSRI